MIPPVVVSESGGAQTAGVEARGGVVGRRERTSGASGTVWEGRPERVRAPYAKRSEPQANPE